MRCTALVDFPSWPTAPGSPRLRLAFGEPLRWLVAHTLAEVRGVLDAAHQAALAGSWCVGKVAYEAAPAFDPAMAVMAEPASPARGQPPLACFAVFDAPVAWPDTAAPTGFHFDPWVDPLGPERFTQQIHAIHELIRAGEVYQINLTSQLESRLHGTPSAAFQALQQAQPGGYALHFATPDEEILSVSPELFFDWRDGRILAQPMKGTAARGHTEEADARAAAHLRSSEKERAENLMIVDLLRNDLARLAVTGGVNVPALFELQTLPTVWQMTSTVQAQARPGLRLSDVFGALFPCGSVTGAPKVRAMHHIRALEAGPRGVYCGALGLLVPGGAATFNVPIRTVSLRPSPEAGIWQAHCGIGSGITLDAQAGAEAEEWRHKRRFLERAARPFELLESLRLQDGLVWLRHEHLARLRTSAAALAVPLDAAAVEQALDQAAVAHPSGAWKLRLLVDARGAVNVQVQAAEPLAAPLQLKLAERPIDARSEFVLHKTTRREIYAPFAPGPGAFDTLLWNSAGELTECTVGNIALRIDDRWLTPAQSCGLLPGTYRAQLIRGGGLLEASLEIKDLLRADAVAFLNSVRGWLPVDVAGLQAQARLHLQDLCEPSDRLL